MELNVKADSAMKSERANLVRARREARAWPQQQLADIADVDLRTIQRLEKNGTAGHETLKAVAQAFGMTVEELSPMSKSDDQQTSERRVHLLPRLAFGVDITSIVAGTDQFQVEHDDDTDSRSVDAMKDILKAFKQDIVRLVDADHAERRRIEDELSQEIQGLESWGYYLFGIKRVIPKIEKGSFSLVSMATVYLSHARSPKVVRDRTLMVVPAVLTEVVRIE
jgi:transcriptional regulator with XRE-family HTH domain